jgi:hypothetical protein
MGNDVQLIRAGAPAVYDREAAGTRQLVLRKHAFAVVDGVGEAAEGAAWNGVRGDGSADPDVEVAVGEAVAEGLEGERHGAVDDASADLADFDLVRAVEEVVAGLCNVEVTGIKTKGGAGFDDIEEAGAQGESGIEEMGTRRELGRSKSSV